VRTPNALIAAYRGEALFFGGRTPALALVYDGSDIEA
jgi:hypothetical protein